MSGENVHEALRDMAADTNGTTQKQVVFMMAAVVADNAEALGKMEEYIKEQVVLNEKVDGRVSLNEKILSRYNKGVWAISLVGVVWIIERILALIAGG